MSHGTIIKNEIEREVKPMTEREGERQSAAVVNVIAGVRAAVTLHDSSIIFFLSLVSLLLSMHVKQYLSLDRSYANEKVQYSLMEYETEILCSWKCRHTYANRR